MIKAENVASSLAFSSLYHHSHWLKLDASRNKGTILTLSCSFSQTLHLRYSALTLFFPKMPSHASPIPSLNHICSLHLRKNSSAQSCSGNDHQPRAGVLKRLAGVTDIAGRTWWSSEVKLETKLFKSSNPRYLFACMYAKR